MSIAMYVKGGGGVLRGDGGDGRRPTSVWHLSEGMVGMR
jgi:hypothetical protein